MTSDNVLAVIFNSTCDDFDAVTPQVWGPAGRALVDALRLQPGERVLDACSGTGASAIPAAHAVGPTGHVDAIDIADDLLARARTRAAADGLTNIDFRCADATALPAPDTPYDVLSCAFGVFFLPDMDNAVRGLLDQIPGGRIGVAVWHKGALTEFTATFFEQVAVLNAQLQPTAGVRSGSDEPRPINRIETVPLITDWLTSLGVVDVRTRVLSLPVPCTDEFAWSMILGSGLRGALGGFSDDQRELLRRNFVQALSGKGIREVNCDTLIAVGRVP